MMNEQKKPMSLGKSLDILRDDVTGLAQDIEELYDLDEDNFKKIQSLIDGMGNLRKRIDHLQARVNRNRGRMVLGFLGAGGLIYIGYKAIDELTKRVQKLEEADSEEKKAEESDG